MPPWRLLWSEHDIPSLELICLQVNLQHLPFECFKVLNLLSFPLTTSKILSLLSLIEKSSSPLGKIPTCTPCDTSSNTLQVFEFLDSVHSLCSSSLSTISLRLQPMRLYSTCAHLARLLCLTFTSVRMRTMLSLLSLQRWTLTSVNAHLADNFTALLAGKIFLRQRNNWNSFFTLPLFRFQTFNMKSYIHTSKQMYNRE